MLSTLLFGSITDSFIALEVVQYPLYGLLIGTANEKGKGAIYALALAIIHLSAMAGLSSSGSTGFLLKRTNQMAQYNNSLHRDHGTACFSTTLSGDT